MSLGIFFSLLITSVILIHYVNGGKHNLGRAVNRFGDDLYRQLSKEEGNIIFSPYSVHSVLSLSTLGAKGNTQKELLSKLYFKNINILVNIYTSQIRQRRNVIDKNINIANTIFYDNSVTLLKSFKTPAKNIFEAYPQEVNFSNKEQAAFIINQWIANQTKQAITSMVDKDTLGPDTLLMLINAIYFKGKWNVTFNKEETLNNFDFHTPKGKVKCKMMVMKKQVHKVYRNRDFQVLVVSFKSAVIKIAFVIPTYSSMDRNEIESHLRKLEESLNDKVFFNAIKNLKSRMIDIYIPKFKLTKAFSLKEHLENIGISKIFKNPDFSNMILRPTKVQDVNQETIVDINEEGVTAAAVTTMRFVIRSGHPPPVTFKLNAPFFFVIYDSKTEVILIKGRIQNPNL